MLSYKSNRNIRSFLVRAKLRSLDRNLETPPSQDLFQCLTHERTNSLATFFFLHFTFTILFNQLSMRIYVVYYSTHLPFILCLILHKPRRTRFYSIIAPSFSIDSVDKGFNAVHSLPPIPNCVQCSSFTLHKRVHFRYFNWTRQSN